jgi:hypothetical protein
MPATEPTRPRPISLTDDQMQFLMTCTEHLAPVDRSRFLVKLAASLRGHDPIGDGNLHRAVANLLSPFAGYFRPPKVDPPPQTDRATRMRRQREAEAIED